MTAMHFALAGMNFFAVVPELIGRSQNDDLSEIHIASGKRRVTNFCFASTPPLPEEPPIQNKEMNVPRRS